MTKVRAAAVYARISSDQQGTGLGVKRQIADCRTLAADRGWTVAEVYQDNDVSAYSGKIRPAYQRMLDDLAAGDRDAVIVYNLDRLHRRPIELEAFAALCEQVGMTNVATVTADIDLGNDDGLFMARLYAAVAAKESGRKSARQKRKMQELAEQGRPHGGLRAYGYGPDKVTIVDTEAAIIREAVNRLLAGETVRSLAAWLADAEIATVTGKPWRTTSLKQMLLSPRIAGLREHHGTVVPAVWPAIITVEQHHKVTAILAARAVSGRRAPRRYLLSGMLRCGRCDNRLFSSPRESTRRYVCLSGPDHGGCGRLTIVADPLERFLTAAVLHRLDTTELAAALNGQATTDRTLTALNEQTSADREQLDELAQAYAAKQITMREWLTAKAPITDRLDHAERRIARATGNELLYSLAGTGSELRGAWETLNLSRQSAVIKAVLDHAVIAPSPPRQAFDPERIHAVWRV